MELNKRYGLITAITMVVGIVIGSGVFFKAEKILNCTGGDMKIGILAWIIGGLIMVIAAVFAHRIAVAYYLIIFAAGLLIGWLFDKKRKRYSA